MAKENGEDYSAIGGQNNNLALAQWDKIYIQRVDNNAVQWCKHTMESILLYMKQSVIRLDNHILYFLHNQCCCTCVRSLLPWLS